MEPQEPRIRDIRVYRPSFVGMVLLVCAAFLILGATPAYGAWATVVLAVTWLVLFALGCIWFGRHPRRVAVAGALALLAWFAMVLVG